MSFCFQVVFFLTGNPDLFICMCLELLLVILLVPFRQSIDSKLSSCALLTSSANILVPKAREQGVPGRMFEMLAAAEVCLAHHVLRGPPLVGLSRQNRLLNEKVRKGWRESLDRGS